MKGLLVKDYKLMLVQKTIPFQLKFGGDKGRIAMIGTFGALAVISTITVKIAKAVFHIDLVRMFNTLPSPGMGMLILIELIFALIILSRSMKISILIINSKEF